MADFTEEEILAALEAKKAQASAPQYSPEEIEAALEVKRQGEPILSREAQIKLSEGATLGARPALKGAGAAIGSGFGAYQALRDMGTSVREAIPQAISIAGESFGEERSRAAEEQRQIAEKSPIKSTALELLGSTLTGPFMAGKGLKAGLKMGAAAGGARALGEAESVEEAAMDVGAGAAFGGALSQVPGVAKWAKEKGGKALTKVSSALTGATQKEISTFADRADDVLDLWKRSGENVQNMADDVREGFQRTLDATRRKLGGEIGKALDEIGVIVPRKQANAILKSLDEQAAAINPKLYPEEIQKINFIRDRIKSVLGNNTKIDGRTIHDLKEFLYSVSKGAFKDSPMTFEQGTKVAKVAKRAARVAREVINDAAPDVAKANNKLSAMHSIEEKAGRGLLKNILLPDTPSGALRSAGAGTNPRARKFLEQLDELTGGNFVKSAEDVASATRFGDASLLPVDTTGKSATRLMTAAGLGFLGGGPTGATILSAMTSPLAVKKAIQAGRFPMKLVNTLYPKIKANQVTDKIAEEIFNLLPKSTKAAGALGAGKVGGAINDFIRSRNQENDGMGAMRRRLNQ